MQHLISSLYSAKVDPASLIFLFSSQIPVPYNPSESQPRSIILYMVACCPMCQVAVAVDMSRLPNFSRLLDYYALSFKNGCVVEGEGATSNYLIDRRYLVPDAISDENVSITQSIPRGGRLILLRACPVADPDMPLPGYTYTKLLTTSDQSYLKPADALENILQHEAGDENGPFTLAMSALYRVSNDAPEKDTRIVLVGSVYALMDDGILQSSSNLDFTMGAFSWLVNREVSIYLRPKSMISEPLAIPDATTLWLLTAVVVIVIPLIVLVAGVLVWFRRRRL